jgi:hypothetical protein
METIGAGSPLVTLLEVAGGVTNLVELFFRYQKSNVEIGQIVGQVESLTARLQQIGAVEQWVAEKCSALHLDLELQALNTLLCAAKKEFVAVRAFCLKCEQDRTSKVKRIIWASKDGSEWDKIASRLRETESSLRSTLQFLSWYVCERQRDLIFSANCERRLVVLFHEENKEKDCCTQAEVRSIGNGVRSILERLEMQTHQPTESCVREPEVAQPVLDRNRFQSPAPRAYERTTQLSRYHYHKSALHVVLERTDRSYQTWRQIAFKLLIGGDTIVEFESVLRTSIFGCQGISFNVRIRNVIHVTSDIVQACEEGNLDVVREIFGRGAARPDDMTDEHHPLLWVRVLFHPMGRSHQLTNTPQYAIKSGSAEVVQCLLDIGSDATILSGHKNA